MAVKYLSGNRVTALSTDLITATTTPLSYTAENGTSYVRYTASRLFGELIQTGNNLIGEKINSVTLKASRHNSGTGGTVLVGVFDNSSNDSPVHTFWTGNATDLPLPSPNTPVDEIVFGKGGTIGGTHTSTDSPTLAVGHVIGIKKLTDSSSSSDDYVYYRKTSATTDSTSKLIEYQSGSWSSSDNGTMYLICKGGGTNRLGSTSPTPTPTSSGGTLSPTSSGSTVLATTSLGFTASNTWVLRFSTIFSSYGDNTYWLAYVANSDAGDQTNQNGIGSNWKKSSGVNTFGVHSSQNAQPYLSNPSDSQTISPDSSSKYYWEIIRLGDTSAKVNYYGTDSTYGTISSTSANTSISNATGLDRIKFFSGSSTNGSRTIAIADVKFYNGITSASATDNAVNVQTNTIAEETDTGKHRMWNSTTNTWTEII